MHKENLPKFLVTKGDKLFGGADAWELQKNSYSGENPMLELLQCFCDEDTEEIVATIEVAEMPGCCGVGVLTGLEVTVPKKGYGEFLVECAMHFAAQLGYTLAIATTLGKSKATTAMAESVDANKAATFTNRKTRNVVHVWTKALPKKDW